MASDGKEEQKCFLIEDDKEDDDKIFKGENVGRYEWKIEDKSLINEILNAKNKQKIESPEFMMANLKWKIRLYPNGNTESDEGSVMIFLQLVSLPPALRKITTSLAFFSKQTMSSITYLCNYTKSGDNNGIPPKTLLLSEWIRTNTKSISISIAILVNNIELNDEGNYLCLSNLCTLNVNKINYTNKSAYFHKIEVNTLNMMKNSWNGRPFESPLFDNMWRLSYYPNGGDLEDKGYFSILLRLCVLPPFIESIKVKYDIKCQETKERGHDEITLSSENNNDGFGDFMTFKAIQSLQSLTFEVQIDIQQVVFVDKEDINCVYCPMQIKKILSSNGQTNISSDHETICRMNQNIEILKLSTNEATAIFQQNKIEFEEMKRDFKDNKMTNDAKLESLTVNVAENNKMMQEMQENMGRLSKQINEIQLMLMEERKNDEVGDMRKEVEEMKRNMDVLMEEKVEKDGRRDGKREEMKKWMRDVVGLPEYVDLLVENGMDDLDVIKHLTANDLQGIGIDKVGHKIKIVKEIEILNRQ